MRRTGADRDQVLGSSARSRALVALAAALVVLLPMSGSATADTPVPGPGEALAEIECPDGSWRTVVLPDPPSQSDIEAAVRVHCPDGETAEPTPPAAPTGDGPSVRVATKPLLRQDLSDLRENSFFVEVSCSRACTALSSVQAIVLRPRALPVSLDAERRLAADTFTRIPVRFKRADVRIFKRATKVRVTGFVTATDAKGRTTTYTWERTCRLAS